MFKPADLFDLSQTEHAAIFDGCTYAWEGLKKIESYIAANLKPALHNRCEGVAFIGKEVFIGDGAKEGNAQLAREMRKPYDYTFAS